MGKIVCLHEAQMMQLLCNNHAASLCRFLACALVVRRQFPSNRTFSGTVRPASLIIHYFLADYF